MELYKSSFTAEEFEQAIRGRSAAVQEKDVNFYDYDGALLYSYTLEEAQALTGLPPAPTPPRDFLVFNEWNWTIKQIREVANHVDVGAVYTPVDGYTRAVLEIESMTVADVTIHVKTWDYDMPDETLIVDWGDGTSDGVAQTVIGSQDWTLHHSYASVGKYVVKFVLVGSMLDLGNGSVTTPFIGNGGKSTVLRELYLGKNTRANIKSAVFRQTNLELLSIGSTEATTIGDSAFFDCHNLKAVIIPSWITRFIAYSFRYGYSLSVISLPYNFTDSGYYGIHECSSLSRLVIPPKALEVRAEGTKSLRKVYVLSDSTAVGGEGFTDCFSLGTVELPDSITTLMGSAFRRCSSLYELTIPQNVTLIKESAFLDAIALKKLRFEPTVPPTVENANAFSGVPTTCVVEVPVGSLTAYQEATNYASIAAQMVEV